MKKGSGKIIAAAIVLLLLIVLAANYSLILDKGFGIQDDSEYMDNEGLIQMIDEKAEGSKHLRDKDLLYSDGNQVVTIYISPAKAKAKP